MGNPRNIAILGSTGSIGKSTLDVISSFPEDFRVTYLSTNRSTSVLSEQIRRHAPRSVVVTDRGAANELRPRLPAGTTLLDGEDGLVEIATRPDVDIVVCALVGFAGLLPTVRAIEAGKTIALANKETLVVAGELIMENVRAHGVSLLPIDSEHSAILQCLRGERLEDISRLILTASGGPFLHLDRTSFESVSVAQALHHPTWTMGKKITIDSATLMNKGLEVIEAHWLFGIPGDRIDVVIHPQSIIHSMVEFRDGSVKAQLGIPDMKIPIQYALQYPLRPAARQSRLDLVQLREMTFLPPDREKFRCLDLAYRALTSGGSSPAVMNAANEVAVQAFLDGRIPFSAIPLTIDAALSAHTPLPHPTLQDLVRIDGETRARVGEHLADHQGNRSNQQMNQGGVYAVS